LDVWYLVHEAGDVAKRSDAQGGLTKMEYLDKIALGAEVDKPLSGVLSRWSGYSTSFYSFQLVGIVALIV